MLRERVVMKYAASEKTYTKKQTDRERETETETDRQTDREEGRNNHRGHIMTKYLERNHSFVI